MPSPGAPPSARQGPAIAVMAVFIAVLALGTVALWWRVDQQATRPSASPAPQLDALLARIRALEQAPSPAPSPDPAPAVPAAIAAAISPAIAPALARIDTLEQELGAIRARPPTPDPPPTPGLDRLQARVEALEQRRITDPTALQARIAAAEQQVAAGLDTLTARISAIEASVIRDLAAALGRVATLEQETSNDRRTLGTRVDTLEQRPIPDPAPMLDRIARLEQRPIPDLPPLLDRIARLEQRPVPDPRTPDRLDGLAGRVEGLSARTADSDRRLDSADARLAVLEASARQIATLAERAARLARLRSAEAALAAGRKLGPLPDAPPALARFADAAPPTEAGLRLAFPAMEQAVRAASRPATDGRPLADRVWERMQDLVTIRQGDQVLIGDSVTGVLARARTALDAGDLAETTQALATLTGDPGQAAAAWLADAQALLEARAALAGMAARD